MIIKLSGPQKHRNTSFWEKGKSILATAIQFVRCCAGAKTLVVWCRWPLAVSSCIIQERSFVFLNTKKMQQLKYNTTGHKAHFISGASCHMFWHQNAIIRQFYQQQNFIRPISISGGIHAHFHDKS